MASWTVIASPCGSEHWELRVGGGREREGDMKYRGSDEEEREGGRGKEA